MSDPVYCYPPDYTVLRNKFDIRNSELLERVERRSATLRIMQGCPTGKFDLDHLRAIHRHVFQDVYDWAGELREVEISKGGTQFMPRQFIETGMADVHRRIVGRNHLKGLSPDDFASNAGQIMGDINHIHPFREGNGRTQLQYLSQLAEQAAHRIDLRKLEPKAWIEASIRSHGGDAARGDYDSMRDCIRGSIVDEGQRPRITQESYAKALRQTRAQLGQAHRSSQNEID